MLPQQYRLKGKPIFTKILKQGRKIWTPFFLFIYINDPESQECHLAFIASKKVGGAVERNRAKRLLREYAFQALKSIPSDVQGVFVANKKTLTLDLHNPPTITFI